MTCVVEGAHRLADDMCRGSRGLRRDVNNVHEWAGYIYNFFLHGRKVFGWNRLWASEIAVQSQTRTVC